MTSIGPATLIGALLAGAARVAWGRAMPNMNARSAVKLRRGANLIEALILVGLAAMLVLLGLRLFG